MNNTLNHPKHDVCQLFVFALCCVLCCVLLVNNASFVAFCTTVPTEAPDAAAQMAGVVSSITQKAYNLMLMLVTPIVIVWWCYAGYQFGFGGNKGTDEAKKNFLRSCGALIIVIFAPTVVAYIASSFKGEGGTANETNWNSFNPFIDAG